ncbi:MAG: 50S ribosomal protein L31e [Promethearchaeota archaeon]
MAKKKVESKEISLDDLEEELGDEIDEVFEEAEQEQITEGKEAEEEIQEIEEFSLDEISEEEEISEIFEEEFEEGEVVEEVEVPKEEEIIDERIYIVPLAKARRGPRNKRAKKSIRFLREYINRHFKPESLVISQEVNETIWSRGAQKPPRKLKIRATKNIDGLVVLYLA